MVRSCRSDAPQYDWFVTFFILACALAHDFHRVSDNGHKKPIFVLRTAGMVDPYNPPPWEPHLKWARSGSHHDLMVIVGNEHKVTLASWFSCLVQ